MSSTDRLKTLYMVWPPDLLAAPFVINEPEGFKLRQFQKEDTAWYFHLLSQEDHWLISQQELDAFLKVVLPDGFFLVEDTTTGEIVATAAAIHNPQGGSHHFPGGGEVAYVLVAPDYRRRGLAKLVCRAVINCFIKEGYTNVHLGVRLGVRPDNRDALRLYAGLEFQPFIYSPEMPARWMVLLESLGLPVEPSKWLYDNQGDN